MISVRGVDGCDALIITYGKVVSEAIAAADALAGEGIKTGIILMEQIAPMEDMSAYIAKLIPGTCGKVIFLEEGVRSGGAGMLLLDRLGRKHPLALSGKSATILAIDDCFVRGKLGESIYETAGISRKHLIAEAKNPSAD